MAQLDTTFSGNSLSGRAYMTSLLFYVGFLLSFFLAWLELSASISLLVGLHITSFHVPSAIVLTIVVAFISAHRMGGCRSKMFAATAYALIAIIISVIIASAFYDRSFDGQAYHQEAILQLAANWNPYYDTLDDSVAHRIWLTHYAKGPWLQASAFYELTSSIESGKATNILLIFISWLFVASLMFSIKQVPIWAGFVIATLASLNPVSVYQSVSYYVDGQLSSIFVSLTALLSMAVIRPNRHILLTAATLILLLVNIKFTGLIYAALIILAYAIASLYINRLRETIRQAWILATGFIIGFLFVGFNPYLTNTFEYGNIFFPLRGDNAIDVVSHTKPIPLKSMNRVEALVTSIFSASSNSKKVYTLKPPFHIPNGSELRAVSGSDPRLGGFGPWFSGALVLSVASFLAILITCKTPLVRLSMVFLLGTLASSVLINPEAWWARYVPQLYLIPLVTCVILYVCLPHKAKKLATVLLLVISLNTAMVLYASITKNIKVTIAINSQLATLSKSDMPITAYFSVFQAMRARLNETGVKFSSVESESQLPCDNPSFFIASNERAKYCLTNPAVQ